jgi:phosphoribosylaminoimidazole carboxylase (NCAIR synthetase)
MNWQLLFVEIHQGKSTYPVVEMEFHPEANQVEYVICPARIDDAVAEKARAIALHVSEKFNHRLIGC